MKAQGLRIAGVLCVVLGIAATASAQAVDAFNPAADNYIHAIAVQKDGKILVGGDFDHLGCIPTCGSPSAVARSRIARLNADGTVDLTFDPGANGPIFAFVIQPDGRIIIGGRFQTVGGGGTGSTPRNRIARLNADGTVDPTFNPGVNVNNSVLALALQPDGKLLVGGEFYAGLGGGVRYFFGRLNADGSLDGPFAPGVDGSVYAIAVQGDGKILLGGLFTHAGGEFGDTERNRIARFNADGSLDLTFDPGANNRVEVIAVQPDGKILVGGIFTGLGGGEGTTPRFNIGRINADGIVDQDFIPGANGVVYTFALQADGRILVGGSFTMMGGGGTGATARNHFARLNADGSLDPFNPGAEGDVYALAIQIDGHILLGGGFNGLGDGTGATLRDYIGRVLNSDAALQSVTVTDGGNTLTWLRNGTMPEIAFADIASSTNGVTYTPLGANGGLATPFVGGWRVTGASLPVHPDLTIRLRGYYPTGRNGSSSSMIEWIVPASDFNVIENGDFTFGLSGWLFFATPDMTYIERNVTNEVLNFFRVPPPPGTTNQAVAYQQTGVALSANVPLVAEFDLGNSSSVRKRVSILIHDSDFSDLSVCTFWLPANSPLTRYGMTTHTTKTWLNLTIAFYAASAGAFGGSYQIDNVAVRYSPGGSTTETMCDDALAPAPTGGGNSATMLVNGDFGSGAVGPGWGLFGQIDGGVTGGVFEFTKLAGTPAGVILQPTGQAVAANELLTATFQLGNMSGLRQRVTVILHDNDFSDLSACTFWLAPGQPLSTYVYRAFATDAWTNATFSVYPATPGVVRAARLDNVTLQRTPSALIAGTQCLEPGSPVNVPGVSARASRASREASPEQQTASGAPLASSQAIDLPSVWMLLDLTSVADASLHLESWLQAIASKATVQVSADGVTWDTVGVIDPSDRWTSVVIDLSAYAGSTIRIRFVVDGQAAGEAEVTDVWLVRRIRIK